MKKPANTSYPWKFASVGGTVRVNIQSGEDIRHLGELDRKLWTVLSCPTSGLEFDETTLKLIDVDKDGKIRVDEVIKTAQWLTRILKNADDLLKENDSLPLDGFNTEDPDGARLQASARQILKNLQLEKDSISLEDTADNVKIFAQTQSAVCRASRQSMWRPSTPPVQTSRPGWPPAPRTYFPMETRRRMPLPR